MGRRDYGAKPSVKVMGLPGGSIRYVVVVRGKGRSDLLTVHYLDGRWRHFGVPKADGVLEAEALVAEDARAAKELRERGAGR